MSSILTFRRQAIASVFALAAMLAACGGGGGGGAGTGGGVSANNVQTPPQSQDASVSGNVLDAKTGAPIVGATVRSGNLSTTTDASGSFVLTAVPPASRVLLTITAANYAEHLLIVQVAANAGTRVSTQLVPVGASQVIDIATGGAVALADSPGQVSIPGNALAGSGAATVSFTAINSSLNPGFLPGDFTNSATGQPIESFAAITVSVNTASGASVSVAAGNLITIRIPASTRSGTLFSSLPLYYLDPTTGRWTEEGVATLHGTPPDAYYEAQVARTGTWSVNSPYETIRVMGCVVDQDNARVAGVPVSADGIDYTGTTTITSDSSGNFSLAMKKAALAVLTAKSGGRTSNSISVGPSASDVDLSSACMVLTDKPQNVTFKLTWGESPRDLDGHLWLPNGDHVFYFLKGSLTARPWANLDVDDTTSFGPEIITLRRLMVGTYTYIVNNFHASFGPGMTGSPTRVELDISGVGSAFTPPLAEGSSTWWTVLTFTVDARCNITVTPVNAWSVTEPVVPPNTGSASYCIAP